MFAVLLAIAWPARADPLLMFLFGVVKEIVFSPSSSPAPAPRVVEIPATYPGSIVEPAALRSLIDQSFTYLSEAQRAEIFVALNAELLKPGNLALTAPLIEHFAYRASQMRAAQERLAHLSSKETQLLLREFRTEIRTLSEAELGQLRSVLERGLLPVPSDLKQLLLAALD